MEEKSRIDELLALVSEQNKFQRKVMNSLEEQLSPEEKAGLNALLACYVKQGDTVEHLADCYLRFVQDIMEEQIYFIKSRHYRYTNSREVNAFFYQNPEYMEYYMKGLAVSAYLMAPHRQCRSWFKEKVCAQEYPGGYIWTREWVTESTSCLLSITQILSDIWASISRPPAYRCAGRWWNGALRIRPSA